PALSADDAPSAPAEPAAPAPTDPQAAAPASSSPFSATDNETAAAGGGSIHQKMRARGGIGPIAASGEPEQRERAPEQVGQSSPQIVEPAQPAAEVSQ